MSFLKTLFRVDSSSKIGTGHLMRSLVYAEKFKNPVFAVRELEGNLNSLIKHKKIILKSNDLQELVNTVKKGKFEHVVIDSYEIGYGFEKELKEKTGVKITVINDRYEKHFCDVFINHNISADKRRYEKLLPKRCVIKCGERYTLIRDEFKKVLKIPKKKASYIKIFLAMGGADTQNLTLEILKILNRFNVHVDVVTTTANRNIDSIKKYIKTKPWIKLYINTDKIAYLIRQSDYGIITPSTLANELYFMGVPFAAVKVAQNQINMYNFLKRRKYPVLERYDRFMLVKILTKELNDIRKRGNTRLITRRNTHKHRL